MNLNKSGTIGNYIWPTYQTWGVTIIPYTFPFNIPQIRQALCDVINRTAVVTEAGFYLYPDLIPQPVPPYTVNAFPPDVRQFITQCTYNPSYAANVLKKYGLTYRNGQWYLPNGTPLTLTIVGPSGFTAWMVRVVRQLKS